jgi:hypothetical protein
VIRSSGQKNPADQAAKHGATDTRITCPHAITTKTWIKAECKRIFYKAWKAELPDSQPSMKYPTNFTRYKWTETRALARVFCGRSPTDSGPYKSPSQCEQCNTDVSSEHYLTTCPRFKRARKQLRKALNTPITPQICLGHTTPLKPVIDFLRKTGLGFSNTEERIGNEKKVQVRNEYIGNTGKCKLQIIHRRARREEKRRGEVEFSFVLNHNFLCLSGMWGGMWPVESNRP